jgi:hypothetical protein
MSKTRPTSTYSVTDAAVTVDMPGKFDSYFALSSVGQGQVEDSDRGPVALHEAYERAERIRRGKGYALRLALTRTDAAAALDCLRDYAETCIVVNGDTATDATLDKADRFDALGEINAAKALIERIDAITAEIRP